MIRASLGSVLWSHLGDGRLADSIAVAPSANRLVYSEPLGVRANGSNGVWYSSKYPPRGVGCDTIRIVGGP